MVQTGNIKFFRKDLAWGFISAGSDDIYFHVSDVIDLANVRDRIVAGQAVRFETIQNIKGLKAVYIHIGGDLE